MTLNLNQIRQSIQAFDFKTLFTDDEKTRQSWKWAKREQGRLLKSRSGDFYKGHSGEALTQRLLRLAVTLSEEEEISLVDVTQRVRAAFDVDRVTKRFYDRFKQEHIAFLEFIKGIKDIASREWHASLMLNRLMFVYFIQKKGFLDGDHDYLRNRLEATKQIKGKNKFHSFYRYFLLRLFHEGFSQRENERADDLEELVEAVPYLIVKVISAESGVRRHSPARIAFQRSGQRSSNPASLLPEFLDLRAQRRDGLLSVQRFAKYWYNLV